MTNTIKGQTTTEFFADLFSTGIKQELEVIANKITKEAQEKFKEEADKFMKDWIFRMVQNFKVTRREDPMSYRSEIVVQLPILKELTNQGGR